jgi:hypothetical protein
MDTADVIRGYAGGAPGLRKASRLAPSSLIGSPGSFLPNLRCIQCDTGEYPLTDSAGLLVDDPRLAALHAGGIVCNLAVESRWHIFDGVQAWRCYSRPELEANEDIR